MKTGPDCRFLALALCGVAFCFVGVLTERLEWLGVGLVVLGVGLAGVWGR